MDLKKSFNSIYLLYSVFVILIITLCAHYYFNQHLLNGSIIAYAVLSIVNLFVNPKRLWVSLSVAIFGLSIVVFRHIEYWDGNITLALAFGLLISLVIIKIILMQLGKQLAIISDFRALVQVFTILFILFYISIGYEIVNAIKKSPPVSGLRQMLSTLQEEATITNESAFSLYSDAVQASRQGYLDKALEHLIKSSEEQPNNPYLHSQLAQLYMLNEDSTNAIAEINKAVSLSDHDTFYLQQRAWIYYKTNKLHKAQTDARQLRRLDNRNASAQMIMAYNALKEEKFELACQYADSANMFCKDFMFGLEIDQFIDQYSGPNFYYQLIQPHETDLLATDIYYYYKKYQTDRNGEPDVSKGMPPSGNFTRQEIKQHIKRNYSFFIDQELDFIYLYENGKNVLVVIRGENSKISKRTLRYVFVEPDVFKNFELRVY